MSGNGRISRQTQGAMLDLARNRPQECHLRLDGNAMLRMNLQGQVRSSQVARRERLSRELGEGQIILVCNEVYVKLIGRRSDESIPKCHWREFKYYTCLLHPSNLAFRDRNKTIEYAQIRVAQVRKF